MQRARTVLLALVIVAGCAPPGDPGEVVGRTAEACGPEGPIDSDCPSAGQQTVHSTGPGGRDHGACCAAGPGFTIEDASGMCGGPVKYFSYACDDFPSGLYQPDEERSWTAYFACCAGAGGPPLPPPGALPRPFGPPPDGPPVDDPGIGGPGYGGPGYGGPGYGGPHYSGPHYSGPDYGGPGYGGPHSSGPGYAEPGYGGPGYGGPHSSGPGYAEPGYGGPGYGGPGYDGQDYGKRRQGGASR